MTAPEIQVPTAPETAPTVTPEMTPEPKRGRGAKRKDAAPTDRRGKFLYVWVDDNVNSVAKVYEETDRVIYAAAVMAFAKLSAEEQLELIKQVKVTNAKLAGVGN